MGTSIAKLRHVFNTQHILPCGAARGFASTELEYLIILARTIFDLLQEMIAKVWYGRVRLNDPTAEFVRKQRKLPDGFSNICLKGKKKIRTAKEIQGEFGLPREMAEQYAVAGHFFSSLRDMRDKVVHGGKNLGMIFETERGFCVHRDKAPFNAFNWQAHHAYNENLVSILPWLANIIVQTLSTCTTLMSTFATLISLPEKLVPGYRVFVRVPNDAALMEMVEISEGKPPWWNMLTKDKSPCEQTA
jgi:hypothetical protein